MENLETRVQTYIDNLGSKLGNNISKRDEILLVSDIDNLMEIIWLKNLNVFIPSVVSEFRNNYYIDEYDEIIDKMFWENFYSMRDTNKKISELSNVLPNKNTIPIENYFPKLTDDKAIKMAHDFFEYYDDDVAEHFYNIIRNGNIILFNNVEKRFSGANFHLFTQKSGLILIDDSLNDITLTSTIIHETIHSYLDSFLNGISYEQMNRININGLTEVYSYFIECAFLKYLEDNKDYENLEQLRKKLSYNLCDFVNTFSYFFNNFEDNTNLNGYGISETYVYGIIMAIHYFEKYLLDSELTKDNILSMFLDSKDFDKHFLLNNYGLYEVNLGNPKILYKHFIKD